MIKRICFRSKGTMQPTSPFLVVSRHGVFINQISNQRSAHLHLATTMINLKMTILWRVVNVNDVIGQHPFLMASQRRAACSALSSPLRLINLQLLINTCGI